MVSLRITTDAKGQPLGQSRNESFGPPIYDKQEVEDRIRRAQLAILNPHRPAASFLKGDESDGDDMSPTSDDEVFGEGPQSLTFSMNCVSLAISGPSVADLSFVDLPGMTTIVESISDRKLNVRSGLIASVGRGGNAGDIKLVEGLVTSYIKKSNCIILLTVACESESKKLDHGFYK